MADKRGLQHPQGLACPLCLDTFKNPTLLLCGHTFCKVCLEGYDELRNGVDHMECPVCRKRTKLEENRVAGLSPNFSLKGLQDELHIDEQTSQNLCPLHKAEYRNIFCEVCENFICITCFIKNHQGHRIIRKTDLKEGLRKKKMALIQDGKARKSQIEKILKDAEQQRKEICCHLSKMEKEIRDAYAKKVTTLQENERKLIEKVHSIQSGSDKQLNYCIAQHIELTDNISISVAILESNESEHLQDHVLIEDHLHCISLENSLKKVNKPNDEQSMAQVLQAAKNSKFHCAKRKLLDVGHIEPGGNATTSNSQQAKAPTSNSQQAKATTSNSQQAKATTSNDQQAKATTSSSQQAKATTSNNQQAKATTSSSQQAKATTSSSQQAKATTSSSQQAKATTSSSQQAKATTSNSQQAKATKSSQQAKTTAPVAVHTLGHNGQGGKASTSSSQQAKTTAPVAVHTLGHNGQRGKASTSNSQHVMTTARVNMNTDEMQPSTSGNVGAIPAMVKTNSLTIVKEAELPGIFGMAAISQDSVVIGYGQNGAECSSLSGESASHLDGGVVYDIACLTHGRSAVSDSDGICSIYDAQGIQGIQYQYNQGFGYRYHFKLCSDQHDNIYAVNGNPEIYIFSGSNPNPQTIIPTGKVQSKQICVTKTGVIIICGIVKSKAIHTLRSVTVYDREGHMGSSIKSNNMLIEYLYAAVDSRDRVLVARIKDRSDVLRLTRYTLQGVTLTKEVMFKQLRLPHSFVSCLCYMVSLSPSMIAFSTGKHLYFIELGL
ncbi:E3 ubiquitin-protein ligase rnf168 isoform X1 [Strongylocentrotus purpuratus]|uniref:Uncharacterized protein n=1 Tax=Strongylocentrotus purpuratus TaxID=7668 RepID=A0A7M7N846_STRPU|nr:E3 ubiquitin-protein ligase rnf168 isoform X1 [Strongylocentrotus purpuratus]